MITKVSLLLCWFALLMPADGSTRSMSFVHQPLTTFGTDSDVGIVAVRVPVLTNTVPESLLTHIGSPNRLLQDESAAILDSNILSLLGITLSAELVGDSGYLVTLDLSRVEDLTKYDTTLEAVVEATIECVNATVAETNLFHGDTQTVVWMLRLTADPEMLEPLKKFMKEYHPGELNAAKPGASARLPSLVDWKSESEVRTVKEVLNRLEPDMECQSPDMEWLTDGKPLALLAFKEEQRLEVWKQWNSEWVLARNYPFTGYSGELGPKLKAGDLQIPEGIYRIEYLNPNSSYYLSIKVDYPNKFDRKKAKTDGRKNLGGDIFIHGMSVTIGCIPIGNGNIEELFYIVAKNGVENTTVVISPRDLRVEDPPQIDGIDWEADLYAAIAEQLKPFRR